MNYDAFWCSVRNRYKFIFCDLKNKVRFLIVTLIVGIAFMLTFSPHLNVRSFIWVQNFGLTFWNKFEKGDWSFVLKVGATTMIEYIDPFLLDFRFDVIHSIKKINPIIDGWLEPFHGRQKRKAKERPKDAQLVGPKKRERVNIFHDRKLFHPWPL